VFSLDQSQMALLKNMILGVGALGVLLMGFDKLMAISGSYRLSERFLWLLALAGGFWGVILGGILFHHKTHKPSFWVPVGLATIAWGMVAFEIWF
jgi:uncharacterized membrane protein YsdA (DUF1294 family)